jgi:hypothetical protein
MESKNRPRSHRKVLENHENLKRTWKSHRICTWAKIKNIQIKLISSISEKIPAAHSQLIFLDVADIVHVLSKFKYFI